MRYRLRTLLTAAVSIVAVSLLVGLVVFVVFALQAQSQMVRNAYCLDWASAAVVQHIEDHEGNYPRDWGELHKAFDKVTSKDHSFSFEEIQARVAVDFSVDPKYHQTHRFNLSKYEVDRMRTGGRSIQMSAFGCTL